MIEYGFERDSLARTPGAIRWWLFLNLENARPQRPRQGVIDRGFRFARGGRTDTAEEARERLIIARDEARYELGIWARQPSHMLGAGGELIPLDEVLSEIEA